MRNKIKLAYIGSTKTQINLSDHSTLRSMGGFAFRPTKFLCSHNFLLTTPTEKKKILVFNIRMSILLYNNYNKTRELKEDIYILQFCMHKFEQGFLSVSPSPSGVNMALGNIKMTDHLVWKIQDGFMHISVPFVKTARSASSNVVLSTGVLTCEISM